MRASSRRILFCGFCSSVNACDPSWRQYTGEERLGAGMEGLVDMETVPASATGKFVGEGRANLVFTLTGVDGHPTFEGMLLQRLTPPR